LASLAGAAGAPGAGSAANGRNRRQAVRRADRRSMIHMGERWKDGRTREMVTVEKAGRQLSGLDFIGQILGPPPTGPGRPVSRASP